jgi:hypothetical protein
VVDNRLINIPIFSVVGYDGTSAFPVPRGAWEHIEFGSIAGISLWKSWMLRRMRWVTA